MNIVEYMLAAFMVQSRLRERAMLLRFVKWEIRGRTWWCFLAYFVECVLVA